MVFNLLVSLLSFLLISEISGVAATNSYSYASQVLESLVDIPAGNGQYYFETSYSVSLLFLNEGVFSIVGTGKASSFIGQSSFSNTGKFSLAVPSSDSSFKFNGNLFSNYGLFYVQANAGLTLVTNTFENNGVMKIIANGQFSQIYYNQATDFINSGALILNNTWLSLPGFTGSGCIVVCNNARYLVSPTPKYTQTHRVLDSSSAVIFSPITLDTNVDVLGFTAGNLLFFQNPPRQQQKRSLPIFDKFYNAALGILKVTYPLGDAYYVDIGLGYNDSAILAAHNGPYYHITTLQTNSNPVAAACLLVIENPITALAVVTSTTLWSGSQTSTTTVTGINAPNTILELDPTPTVTTTSLWSLKNTATFTEAGTDVVTIVIIVPSPTPSSSSRVSIRNSSASKSSSAKISTSKTPASKISASKTLTS